MYANKRSGRLLSLVLVFCMLFGLTTTGAAAAEQQTDTSVSQAILYTISGKTVEYNAVHSARITPDTAVSDTSGSGMTTVDALADALGTPEALGMAVLADLELNGDSILSIEVTDVYQRPTIGISWKGDKIGGDYQGFAEAFARNGARALFLPQVADEAEAAEVLACLDGIFMTGGADWNPTLYNQAQSPHGCGRSDDARDTSDISYMRQAIELNVPMLAVCRGEQGFNVAMGGGLVQDVPYYLGQKVLSGEISADRVSGVLSGPSEADLKTIMEVNGYTSMEQVPEVLRTPVKDTGYLQRDFFDGGSTVVGPTYTKADPETGTPESWVEGSGCEEGHLRVQIDGLIHSGGTRYHELESDAFGEGIAIDPESRWLYDIIGSTSVNLVATAHHQSVDPELLGENIRPVAFSSDGIIEAIEYTDPAVDFALGLQWHPERDALGGTSGEELGVDVDLCNAPLRALSEHAAAHAEKGETILPETGVLLYPDAAPVDGVPQLGYNVAYSASITDNTNVVYEADSRHITVEELNTLMGTSGDLGPALTADLYLNSDSHVVMAYITGSAERPTVGISWKSDHQDYSDFLTAFERNGAIAVELPQITDVATARKALGTVDGIFMTGGEDWNPALYGEEAYVHGSSGWNDVRDTSDLNLMQQAIKLDVPMLAVCRGEQGFNVAMGGGLIQDVPTYLGQEVKAGRIDKSRVTELEDPGIVEWYQDANGQWQKKVTPCDPPHYRVVVDDVVHSGGTRYHELCSIDPNSKWLYDIVGDDHISMVATAHHQSVNPNKLGDGLTIVARSSDGIVEAIEHQDSLFALGLQWHPERDALGGTQGAELGVDVDLSNAFLRTLVEYASIKSGLPDVVLPDEHERPAGPVEFCIKPTACENGSIHVSARNLPAGETLTVTVEPDSGYRLDRLTVTTSQGSQVAYKSTKKDNQFTFVMPRDSVTVAASFRSSSSARFVDVPENSWYYDAVMELYNKGIMTGTGADTFSPDLPVTRGMLVTTLWQLEGRPQVDYVMSFNDVDQKAYYAEAVRWAASNQVVSGYDLSTFGPNDPVTREQLAAILFRLAVRNGVKTESAVLSFADAGQVSDWAREGLSWCVSAGLISGMDNNLLMPQGQATRAQTAVILSQYSGLIK